MAERLTCRGGLWGARGASVAGSGQQGTHSGCHLGVRGVGGEVGRGEVREQQFRFGRAKLELSVRHQVELGSRQLGHECAIRGEEGAGAEAWGRRHERS